MNRFARLTFCVFLLSLGMCRTALAQREMHWDALEVSAHLRADGQLDVTETHAMVFTGEWNGGERRFRLFPQQTLTLLGVHRWVGERWQRLTEDPRLDDVDEYAWTDSGTLRWRTRRLLDPPFAKTVVRYQLHYLWSPVVLKEDGGYRLDHDFAFPDRGGTIARFILRFTHDPGWQPGSDVPKEYTAGPLSPGDGFVLSLPLRHTGLQMPATLRRGRPPAIVMAVSVLLGFPALALAWFFFREHSYGRFAPLASEQVDERWLQTHVLKHPAEVVAAAWDGSIGKAEVVALIARMVSEGKLDSRIEEGKDGSSMALRLKAGRATLEGHERTLVEQLFFDGRTETNTKLVIAHYWGEGFDPVEAIKPELETLVALFLSSEDAPRAFRVESLVLFVFGVGVLMFAFPLRDFSKTGAVPAAVGALIVAAAGWIAGFAFRMRIDWGQRAALVCLIPAFVLAAVPAGFLWFVVGVGTVDLSTATLLGLVAISLALSNASINGLRSRESRRGIAVRKTLAAGRAFFVSALANKDRAAWRDEWYPWALAFGLTATVDDWSTPGSVARPDAGRRWSSDEPASPALPTSMDSAASTSTASTEQWSGFRGGRSGGAGGGGSWAAAAAGIAGGVSAPRSARGHTDSGGSSSSIGESSGSSGSSGNTGTTGGGGGGGW